MRISQKGRALTEPEAAALTRWDVVWGHVRWRNKTSGGVRRIASSMHKEI